MSGLLQLSPTGTGNEEGGGKGEAVTVRRACALRRENKVEPRTAYMNLLHLPRSLLSGFSSVLAARPGCQLPERGHCCIFVSCSLCPQPRPLPLHPASATMPHCALPLFPHALKHLYFSNPHLLTHSTATVLPPLSPQLTRPPPQADLL